MGPRHSKRSLDMAGTPTKSEIEGVGNAGKLEKIVDGIVEKVSANGHVDGELQNGAEPLQNGVELVQNGEAAAVAVDHSLEKIKLEEKEEVVGINSEIEDKVNGDIDEKVPDAEGKEDKKDKKKEKKEKVVKKKFSFRSFSFSKKDKSKPKEEKVSEPKEKAGIEETPEKLGDNVEEKVEESKEATVESEVKDVASSVEVAVSESLKENTVVTPSVLAVTVDKTVTETIVPESPDVKAAEKIAVADDLPPPLPASPPPSEMKEGEGEEEEEEGEGEGKVMEMTEDIRADSKGVNAVVEVTEAGNDVLTASEQLEEKATDLLKTVEEKVEESKRKESEIAINNSNCDSKDDVEVDPSHTSNDVIDDGASSTVLTESFSKTEESLPKTASSIVILSANTEETIDKQEEFGAGESLAEMDTSAEPAVIANEVTAAD